MPVGKAGSVRYISLHFLKKKSPLKQLKMRIRISMSKGVTIKLKIYLRRNLLPLGEPKRWQFNLNTNAQPPLFYKKSVRWTLKNKHWFPPIFLFKASISIFRCLFSSSIARSGFLLIFSIYLNNNNNLILPYYLFTYYYILSTNKSKVKSPDFIGIRFPLIF